MNISALQALYREGQLTPSAMVEQTYGKIDSLAPVWISLVPKEVALAQAASLEARGRRSLRCLGFRLR